MDYSRGQAQRAHFVSKSMGGSHSLFVILFPGWNELAQPDHHIQYISSPMANEVMKRHVSRGDLNSPHQQKVPVSAFWQSIMGNRLHEIQECGRFYFSTRYIRLGMTKYFTCIILYKCLVTVLSMLKRLKSALAVFVFEQSDLIFLCVSAIHARRFSDRETNLHSVLGVRLY